MIDLDKRRVVYSFINEIVIERGTQDPSQYKLEQLKDKTKFETNVKKSKQNREFASIFFEPKSQSPTESRDQVNVNESGDLQHKKIVIIIKYKKNKTNHGDESSKKSYLPTPSTKVRTSQFKLRILSQLFRGPQPVLPPTLSRPILTEPTTTTLKKTRQPGQHPAYVPIRSQVPPPQIRRTVNDRISKSIFVN